MLSEKEKQEILADGRSARRREAFRKARVAPEVTDLDSYLRFLDSVTKTFSKITRSVRKPARPDFKL